MITRKHQLKAGALKAALAVPFIAASVAAAATAHLWLDAGEPTWPMWALAGGVLLVWSFAFAFGYRNGPVVERVNTLKFKWYDFESHVDSADLARSLSAFFHRWQEAADTRLDVAAIWQLLDGYKVYVVEDVHGAAGKHFRSSRRIELEYAADTLRWEIGHALMYEEHAMGTEVANPAADVSHEPEWFKWRKARGLL
jgi:hypothetical protein